MGLITAEREKRKSDEEKSKMETSVNKLEGDIRMLNREKDRLKEDCDIAKKANRENLAQTEEGLKAFKDQIDHSKLISKMRRANTEILREHQMRRFEGCKMKSERSSRLLMIGRNSVLI